MSVFIFQPEEDSFSAEITIFIYLWVTQRAIKAKCVPDYHRSNYCAFHSL